MFWVMGLAFFRQLGEGDPGGIPEYLPVDVHDQGLAQYQHKPRRGAA